MITNNVAEISSDRQSSQTSSFDIREHAQKLEPTKERNKYICPVCGGNDFAVNPNNGAYHCFNSDCSPEDIRNAIAPLPEREFTPRSPRPRNTAPKLKPVALPEGLQLVRVKDVDRTYALTKKARYALSKLRKRPSDR
ncbi:MAG: hypothetical protein HC862_24410 [Scytonema sp. RU_4_4]|nr:hypothetical protein [Scytonema sp. RU_4_4]